MLTERHSWNLFFYVEFAFAMALIIATFLIVEETSYRRNVVVPTQGHLSSLDGGFTMKERGEHHDHISSPRLSAPVPTRKTYIQSLALWSTIDHETGVWTMIPRSFTYFAVPAVFWVVATYGKHIMLMDPPIDKSTNQTPQVYLSAAPHSPSVTRFQLRSQHLPTTGRPKVPV